MGVFSISFFLAVILTLLVRRTAVFFKILDRRGVSGRKIHAKPTPLWGGLALFLSFFAVLAFNRAELTAGGLDARHWLGFFAGACFLMLGGILDDKYSLKPRQQIIFPVLACMCVIAGGVSIEKITNPLGGLIYLEYFSSALIFVWLMGMMYTTKLLDGIDGLVSGVSLVGAAIIFLFTITTRYYQPDIALASLVLAGSILGFLVFNFHPARIFLGEGGSLFLGYAIGVLSIISGSKIAIALLVMGIPIMDVLWIIIRRLNEGKNPFSFADRKHLHHRLYDLGFSQPQVVFFYVLAAAFFGAGALFLQSRGKLVSLGVLILLMLALVFKFRRIDHAKNNIKN